MPKSKRKPIPGGGSILSRLRRSIRFEHGPAPGLPFGPHRRRAREVVDTPRKMLGFLSTAKSGIVQTFAPVPRGRDRAFNRLPADRRSLGGGWSARFGGPERAALR